MVTLYSFCQLDEFAVGDEVQVCDSLATVQELQKDHGEWTETMRNVSRLSMGSQSFLPDCTGKFEYLHYYNCATIN